MYIVHTVRCVLLCMLFEGDCYVDDGKNWQLALPAWRRRSNRPLVSTAVTLLVVERFSTQITLHLDVDANSDVSE